MFKKPIYGQLSTLFCQLEVAQKMDVEEKMTTKIGHGKSTLRLFELYDAYLEGRKKAIRLPGLLKESLAVT